MSPRLIVMLPALIILQACAAPGPRRAEDFLAISRANLERSTLRELTGFDPVLDWGPLIWVEQSLAPEQDWNRPLFLQGVGSLRPEEAETLGRMKASRIFLPDLEALDPETARSFARPAAEDARARGKELHLNGLRRLDLDTARALVAYRSSLLSLGGLTAIDVELATILAATEGGLWLDGLDRLGREEARSLAAWEGWGEQVLLSLRGLRRLDAEIAIELAACKGWGLDLSGLVSLDPAVARALTGLDNPYLALDGLREISPATAREISDWQRKFLTLDGIRTITPEIRALLEQGTEALSFRSLER